MHSMTEKRCYISINFYGEEYKYYDELIDKHGMGISLDDILVYVVHAMFDIETYIQFRCFIEESFAKHVPPDSWMECSNLVTGVFSLYEQYLRGVLNDYYLNAWTLVDVQVESFADRIVIVYYEY